eukprot:scaffold1177_cov126-Isochrysis_galbana.AAC.11
MSFSAASCCAASASPSLAYSIRTFLQVSGSSKGMDGVLPIVRPCIRNDAITGTMARTSNAARRTAQSLTTGLAPPRSVSSPECTGPSTVPSLRCAKTTGAERSADRRSQCTEQQQGHAGDGDDASITTISIGYFWPSAPRGGRLIALPSSDPAAGAQAHHAPTDWNQQ